MDRGAWWATVHGVTKSQEVLINHDNKTHSSIQAPSAPHPGGLGAGTQMNTVDGSALTEPTLGRVRLGTCQQRDKREIPDVRGAVKRAGEGWGCEGHLRWGGPRASEVASELNRGDEMGWALTASRGVTGAESGGGSGRCRAGRRLGALQSREEAGGAGAFGAILVGCGSEPLPRAWGTNHWRG